MGATRKTLSLITLGLVDFRSDRERTAAYTRGARKHARRQAGFAKKQYKVARRAAGRGPVVAATAEATFVTPTTYAPPVMPAGWYGDPNTPGVMRYWTGTSWTQDTAPLPPR